MEIKTEPVNRAGVRADFINERYGPHERNRFDLWKAKSEDPSPLVVYIHGGGFLGGDKSKYYDSADLVRFLDAGVSVATINYRFMNEPPFGIPGSMDDAKYFLQFIRYNHQKFNVDKSRIACSGGSAGAGIALWLAFSDDMADKDNPDPVLRESTRLTAAGAFATQCTYDFWQWDDVIGVPFTKSPEHLLLVAQAFGFNEIEKLYTPEAEKVRTNLDFLTKMSKNGSPVYIYNKQHGGIPSNQEEIHHHPNHAKRLKEKADATGLQAIVYAPEIGITDPSGKDLVTFFSEKFRI